MKQDEIAEKERRKREKEAERAKKKEEALRKEQRRKEIEAKKQGMYFEDERGLCARGVHGLGLIF